MLNSFSQLLGTPVDGSDGDLGHVREALLDDRSWALRYLVIETGDWFNGRKLLLSTQSLRASALRGGPLRAQLSRQQLHSCPPLDTSHPLTRLQERRLLHHYRLSEYWSGDGEPFDGDAVHLRPRSELKGFAVCASDAVIGHLRDFVVDDEDWTLRSLVIDTSGWWKDGQLVMIDPQSVAQLDMPARQLHLRLTRGQLKASPPFDVPALPPPLSESIPAQRKERATYWM